ncbi:MAG: CDP-2,3-bis-(O-geranylgeranyl)-sn-glycerol synthase [Candidatus Bathyarchaeota archaeon]|nr:MAG: CDP-2,3-bis-(O-geranylgeranyl)-sn-glycerol synthase [Candidatus Bathyarchaeota archaeon]
MEFDFLKLLFALYAFLPAYVANATPTIFGGGATIDGERRFVDGRPIFGSHKTIRGFLSGLIAGTIIGFIQGQVLSGFLLSFGALFGDLAGAFLKRRLSIPPGSIFPIIDQLSFVLFAILFVLPFSCLTIEEIFSAIFFTPFFHLMTNTIAYFLNIKKHPW